MVYGEDFKLTANITYEFMRSYAYDQSTKIDLTTRNSFVDT